jgi:hypothetical protein
MESIYLKLSEDLLEASRRDARAERMARVSRFQNRYRLRWREAVRDPSSARVARVVRMTEGAAQTRRILRACQRPAATC